MNEPRWLDSQTLLVVHDMLIAEHGGVSGIRDIGLLESALDKPKNLGAYRPESTLWEFAAAYVYGISSNHAFADGNKRTAFMAAYVFLADNGWEMCASEIDAALTFQALAGGSISEEQIADWFYENCEEIPLDK